MDGTTLMVMAGGGTLVVSAASLLLATASRARAPKKQQAAVAKPSAKYVNDGRPSDTNPVTGDAGTSVGAALRDPTQGGQCQLAAGRKNACGGPGCDGKLPSCPGYGQNARAMYSVQMLEKPTGVTNKSKALTNGLDPQGILDMINKLRATLGAAPITWDDRLACAAAAWAPLTNYDTCPHGAAPGFSFFPQVVGASASLTLTPMQVAQEAIVQLMWNQEKPIADSLKLSPTAKRVQAGWTKCGAYNADMKTGHYCVLGDDGIRCCGFAFGLNYTKSGYINPPQTVTPVVVGMFA